MQTRQASARSMSDLAGKLGELAAINPNLVLLFASPDFFTNPGFSTTLSAAFPSTPIIGCSTAGEISGAGVFDKSCTLSAMRLDHGLLKVASTDLTSMDDSRAAGHRLAEQLSATNPRAVMVFGQGVQINGSALIEGMTEVLGAAVTITGGLAGDDGAFTRTWTIGPAGISNRAIVAVAFAGERLNFSHGSFGGWSPFGPARRVTRCVGNVLFELDGEPALEIYKRYLGDHAKDLPASGLLFPFAMLAENRNEIGLIRTILGVSEADGSLVLAGEIQADGYLQLMHASTDALVDGAEAAAKATQSMRGKTESGLAILVSCVGRKLVMGDRVDEEVEAVADVLGRETVLTGFYSYGEISPFTPGVSCKLHNQTMTITTLSES